MQASAFVLFGATGDLAKRKIFPALYNLYLEGKLPDRFAVFALGRKPFNDDLFRLHIAESLGRFSRKGGQNASAIADFTASIQYLTMDAYDPKSYLRLKIAVERREAELGLPGNRLFYLSVAPEHFGPIALHIRESGLGDAAGGARLIIEKPFGRDLASARSLNEALSQAFPPEDIFYIDHYLGKPMVQNLQALIASNPVLKAVLNNHYVANVQITASETVGVEERAGYYDKAGALRDMFQNHMLQLLMMTARHSEVYDKRKIIDSAYPVAKEEAAHHVVLGQYVSGRLDGREMAGYREEPGVDPQSVTETYAAARLTLDDPIWRGVPFYIRTGKRLSEKSTRIVVVFKDPMERHTSDQPARNYLIVHIQPDQSVDFQLNLHGLNGEIQPVQLHFASDAAEVPEAYELLLYDALRGDATFFAHWDEIELSWKWMQPILDAIEEGLVPLHDYPAGSLGPPAADRLLAEQGFAWVENDHGRALEPAVAGEQGTEKTRKEVAIG
ncbi:glucose-6-phosphate dehydrogenase [Cohnella sp. REN36]|uniref:glucose-6-phosphate dehydrogenase n=1 Tax=Cohnella sp. REN36 TaxID=2887347 RepID=UPI001D156CD9|nr:glucose-6-phosphate dehydrogenase [Cohnella sp. REN36]MCC3371724.1 glucose-6-phosphate dehydrogenase [Cohnella sp. REN36]